MKRIFVMLLALAMVPALYACAGERAEPTPSPKPTIDIKNTTQIRQDAKKAIEKYPSFIVQQCPDSKVRAYDLFTVGSVDVDTSEDNKTIATVHGYFFGYDEYKSLVGKFKFDANVIYELGDSGGSIPAKDIVVFKD